MAWTTPITYTVGQVLTAATCNAQLRDNENFLKGDASWTAPTLLNSWVNSGAPQDNAGYKKVGDYVQLRGAIKSGATNTIAFVLGTGYRPTATIAIPVVAGGGTPGISFLQIDTSGNVTVVQVGGTVSSVTYLVAPPFQTI